MTQLHTGTGYLRAYWHKESRLSPWYLYESAKNIWLAAHPDHTPAELQRFTERLARECGLVSEH